MKKTILLASISFAILTLNTAAHAKIYKWTDAKGVIHYSATPPAQAQKTKFKDIEEKIRFAVGKAPADEDKANTNASTTNEATSKEEKDPKLSPPSKKLISYCKTQRANLAALKTNFNNIWVEPNGTRKKLNQKERKEKVQYLIKKITEECEGI